MNADILAIRAVVDQHKLAAEAAADLRAGIAEIKSRLKRCDNVTRKLTIEIGGIPFDTTCEIAFHFSPAEPPAGYYPGSPASADVEAILWAGVDLLPGLPGEVVREIEQDIAEGER